MSKKNIDTQTSGNIDFQNFIDNLHTIEKLLLNTNINMYVSGQIIFYYISRFVRGLDLFGIDIHTMYNFPSFYKPVNIICNKVADCKKIKNYLQLLNPQKRVTIRILDYKISFKRNKDFCIYCLNGRKSLGNTDFAHEQIVISKFGLKYIDENKSIAESQAMLFKVISMYVQNKIKILTPVVVPESILSTYYEYLLIKIKLEIINHNYSCKILSGNDGSLVIDDNYSLRECPICYKKKRIFVKFLCCQGSEHGTYACTDCTGKLDMKCLTCKKIIQFTSYNF